MCAGARAPAAAALFERGAVEVADTACRGRPERDQHGHVGERLARARAGHHEAVSLGHEAEVAQQSCQIQFECCPSGDDESHGHIQIEDVVFDLPFDHTKCSFDVRRKTPGPLFFREFRQIKRLDQLTRLD